MAKFEINRRSEYDLSITGMSHTDVRELKSALELMQQQLPPQGLPKIAVHLINALTELQTGRSYMPQTVEME